MSSIKKSTKVPKNWESYYAQITATTDEFCKKHLNDEYATLARYAIAALCRKRPSPLASGKRETWACAVLYALGQTNYLSDKASLPYMSKSDLSDAFGIAISTAGNKAKHVRETLKMNQLSHDWMLPSRIDDNPLVWTLTIDGFAMDARRLPEEIQEIAVQKGLIPYVFKS